MKKTIAILILSVVALAATFALDFASLNKSAGGGLIFDSYSVKEGNTKTTEQGFGLYGFYDMQYIVFSLGYYKIGGDLDIGFMDLSVLGKYPIDMDKFTLFPMAGLTYNRAVTGVPDGADAGDMSNLGLKVGVGLDYNLSGNFFIRPTGMYAFYLKNSAQKDAMGSDSSITGLQISVAAGIKL